MATVNGPYDLHLTIYDSANDDTDLIVARADRIEDITECLRQELERSYAFNQFDPELD